MQTFAPNSNNFTIGLSTVVMQALVGTLLLAHRGSRRPATTVPPNPDKMPCRVDAKIVLDMNWQ
jgi:hypothetical protein